METKVVLEDIVKNKEPFSEWQMKNIHNLILKGINDRYAGNYRDQQVFIDGNGRTSRLLLNLELMKQGYPPVVIRVENRQKYYMALDQAHTKGAFWGI